ncbi:MAG: hypothetical protein ACRCSG_02460 [Cellulosilyticaceae bacterium]
MVYIKYYSASSINMVREAIAISKLLLAEDLQQNTIERLRTLRDSVSVLDNSNYKKPPIRLASTLLSDADALMRRKRIRLLQEDVSKTLSEIKEILRLNKMVFSLRIRTTPISFSYFPLLNKILEHFKRDLLLDADGRDTDTKTILEFNESDYNI